MNVFFEREKNVVVYLRGGLGNQLFQYFVGRRLAAHPVRRLLLNTSLLPSTSFTNRRGVSVFPDAIGKLNHSGEMRRSNLYKFLPEKFVLFLFTRLAQVDRSLGGMIPKIWTKLGRLSSNKFVNIESANQACFNIVLNSPCLENRLNGEDIRKDIQQLFAPTSSMSRWFFATLKQNLDQRPVSIHVRLGDHLHLEPNLDFGYYTRVRDWIDKFRPDSPVWIFSDDPIKARDLLANDFAEALFIEPDETSDDIESFIVMASSPVLVCGRSTYSLWASELVSAKNGTVLADKEWVRSENPPVYLDNFSEDWILV